MTLFLAILALAYSLPDAFAYLLVGLIVVFTLPYIIGAGLFIVALPFAMVWNEIRPRR